MKKALLISIFSLAAVSWSASAAHANRAQRQILDFSVNIGWAVGTLDIHRADNTTVLSSISRARSHLSAAVSAFGEPHRSRWIRNGTHTRLQQRLANYQRNTRGRSARYKRNYLYNVWTAFRSGLSTIYDSRRRWQYRVTCDSALAQIGLHYGRASIGSMAGRRGWGYARSALGQMRQGIRSALSVALDGYNRSRTHARKLCCNVGSPSAWRGIARLNARSSLATLRWARRSMQRTVANAASCSRRRITRRRYRPTRRHRSRGTIVVPRGSLPRNLPNPGGPSIFGQ